MKDGGLPVGSFSCVAVAACCKSDSINLMEQEESTCRAMWNLGANQHVTGDFETMFEKLRIVQ